MCAYDTLNDKTVISAEGGRLSAVRLRTQWLENPSAIEARAPRLSWELQSDGCAQRQSGWHIIVATSPVALRSACRVAMSAGDVSSCAGVLWDSGLREGGQTLGICYDGCALRSSQQVYWSVRVWDADGLPSDWSGIASWSMGLLDVADWHARWISYRDHSPLHKDRESLHLPPAAYYRREFESLAETDIDAAAPSIERAVLYISALGLCEAWMNGEKVGDAWFEPGWSDYRNRAYYRAHDVTSLMREGTNTLGAIVADGWYSGYVGFGLFVGYGPFRNGRNFYGKTPALLAQLEIHYSDGTVRHIGTDETWEVSTAGAIREADILMGEAYDARLANAQWCSRRNCSNGKLRPEHDWAWSAAIAAEDNGRWPVVFFDTMGANERDIGFAAPLQLQSYTAPPIRAIEELAALQMRVQVPNTWVFDLGQNFAGVVRLSVCGQAGARIRLRYAEQCHADGAVMTENLRRARATDFYTLAGSAEGECWTPRFTYHGFRYVELTLLEGEIRPPDTGTITGIVLHNDTPLVGSFECSDPVMTRFAKNALWTQRANFFEVPTDCPQRDERLGWTGDAMAFIRTATFHADVAAFFTKWMDDVAEAQLACGAYPDYCPFPMTHGKPYSTGWTDAGVICPWTIWQVYGDVHIIDKHWESMERFMDWRLVNRSPEGGGLASGNTYGDWLNLDDPTSIEYLDTCYHALCCRSMAQMAKRTGRHTAAEKYRLRLAEVTAAFCKIYIDSSGRLRETSQTAYVFALWLELMPESLRPAAAAALADKIHTAGVRMRTGFLGSRLLLPVLSDNGYHDLALRLFQRREFPSWGYEVVNGATTVWERWDSYTREYGFSGRDGTQNASMNSFSHYTFGAVMEWAFRYLAGIDSVDDGFGQIRIHPRIPAGLLAAQGAGDPIRWVRASYRSVRGLIISNWKVESGMLEMELAIPAGVEAEVVMPAWADCTALLVNGNPCASADGMWQLDHGSTATLRIASGKWLLQAPWCEANAPAELSALRTGSRD